MVLFTHIIKKIKGAAYKNGDVDGTCKRSLKCELLTFTFKSSGWGKIIGNKDTGVSEK